MVKIQNLNTVEELERVTRVEVIDGHGRSYVHYNADLVEYSIQDNGRTLKIFIKDKRED
jgi:hypothetical protein